MRLTRILLIALGLVLASGCSLLKHVEESPMTAELITNQLTFRFLAGADVPADRADKLRNTLQRIQAGLGGEYTLEQLETKVREEIDWQKYSLADQELLSFALGKAGDTIRDLVGEGKIDPEEQHTVDTLFRWIDNAALRVSQTRAK